MPPTLPTCALRAAARPSFTRLFAPSRALSTTRPTLYQQYPVPNSDIPIPSVTAPHPEIPAYPLGPRQAYHQSNTGLYGTAMIRFGNKVSSRNEIKTRRAWRPNVHHKRLWSASLGMFVRTRVTTRVLRTIDKVGGLDAYLLGIKPARIKELGPWGWRLRWRVMQTPSVQEQLRKEREALGLGEPLQTAEGNDIEASLSSEEKALAGEEKATAAAIYEQTSTMLANEEEFAIGEEEKPFMREEKPGKKASKKA